MENISIDTVLEYTPYDNKCPSPFGIRYSEEEEENLFYENKLFVDYPPACDGLKLELVKHIKDETIHAIIFSGTSGSGKTTFLKHFFRIQKKDILCHFINLLEKPTIIDNDECVRNSITYTTGSIFSKEVASKFYQTFQNRKQENIIKDYDVDFLGNKLKRFLSFCYLYSRDSSKLDFIEEIKKFDINTMQLLSLYLISNVIINKDSEKPLVFVFDNLDELDKQYLNTNFYELILSAFSIAQGYCERVLRYAFVKKVTFILSFRKENERFFKGDEASERYKLLHSVPIDFSQDYQASYETILKARILYYDKNKTEDTSDREEELIKTKYDGIRLLIESENSFFNRLIKPLYSYDYRMFTHFAIKNALRNRTLFIPKALIKSDKIECVRQGARGMLLFYALAGMLSDDKSRFSSYVKEEFSDDQCNIYRMSFTLLSHMCGWSHNKKIELLELLKDEVDFNEKTRLVYLNAFMQIIESWYPEDKMGLVSTVLDGLIGSTARSFECPIVLIGSAINEYIKILGNSFSISSLATKVIQDYLDNPTGLSTVRIQVNPLCIVYASRIFIHYEYFNLISTQWDNIAKEKKGMNYDPKPLFQLDGTEKNKKNIELCLAFTYESAKKVIESADIHFCRKCKYGAGKCNSTCQDFIKEFIDEGLCFNGTMHATRVVTSHIHYLEQYRKYLWSLAVKKDEHSELDIELQKIIIGQILEYITFYRNRKIKDSKYNWISNDWWEQYTNAFEILENDPQHFTEIIFVHDEEKDNKENNNVNG